ncbi:MAG: alpha-glucuronidase family glycosyl hydrolase [Planctomycetota bacterium]
MCLRYYCVLLVGLMLVPGAVGEGRVAEFFLVRGGEAEAMVVAGLDAGRVERTAVGKFLAGVEGDGGSRLLVGNEAESGVNCYVVMGTVKSNAELGRLAAGHQLAVGGLGEEDYLLRTLVEGGKRYLLIVGGGERGVLYGAQEALDQVVTSTSGNDVYVEKCNIRRSPAIGVRGTYCLTCWGGSTKYPRSGWEEAFDSMADAGMNRVMFWMDGLFRSQRHPGAFLGKPKQLYHGTPITHDDIQKLIDYAHARGMDFYLASGVFGWFTAGGYIAKEFPETKAPKGKALCPSNPVAQKVTLEYLSEMIEVFPQADGYMLEIRDELGECWGEICQKPLDKRGSKQYGQSELDLLEKLRTTVWAGHPKTKFIWLIGYSPHKEDVLYYERIREMGRDQRMEWLEVRNSWTLPSKDGGRKPLRYFSDRIYHWDQYYRFSGGGIQGHARRTVNEGLNGFLPAYEPGFRSYSIYRTGSTTPFPVRLIPFCLTQFYYREYTWEPGLSRKEVVNRGHRKYFTAEVPVQMVRDLFFLKDFMVENLTVMLHQIGAGLGPKGCGLLCTVKDIWTVERRGGIERKIKLLEGVAVDIKRFRDMVEGAGEMARVLDIERRMAELRPVASRRSRATFDIMQRAIDDMRAEFEGLEDYKEESGPALVLIEKYLKELKGGGASK